jgi:hypothetical protein
MVVLKLGRGKGPDNWGKGLRPGQAGKDPKDWGKGRGSRKALMIWKSLWQAGNALKIGNRPVASQPLQKGGYVGSRRRTVIGSDHRLGPIQKKYGRESMPSCAARL